mgnify:CR=1 FL=1
MNIHIYMYLQYTLLLERDRQLTKYKKANFINDSFRYETVGSAPNIEAVTPVLKEMEIGQASLSGQSSLKLT